MLKSENLKYFHTSLIVPGMTFVATSACIRAITAAPITRAKYSQRMNGRTMAANRTCESKNGFTPLRSCRSYCRVRFIEKATTNRLQIITSERQRCLQTGTQTMRKAGLREQNLCRCLQNYKQLVVKWKSVCRWTIGANHDESSRTLCRTRNKIRVCWKRCSENEENADVCGITRLLT